MNWKLKALMQMFFAFLPKGNVPYTRIQRRFGSLKSGPDTRLPQFLQLAGMIKAAGGKVEGASFVELGTGHIPNIPICLALCGASSVHTFDLNPRIQADLVKQTFDNLLSDRSRYEEIFSRISDPDTVSSRFDILNQSRHDAYEALADLGIEYYAPYDAKKLPFSAGSIDYCVSVTVLEHIPPVDLIELLVEEARICGDRGKLVHIVDLSDHFAHSDDSISRINFLKYSELSWKLIAENEYAYCNRLRASEFKQLLAKANICIDSLDTTIDQQCLDIVSSGFPIDQRWKDLDPNDLCCTEFSVVAR